MASRYLYLYGGAIGDALVGIHTGRLLAENIPSARLELISTRHNVFVKEMVANLPFIEYRELDKKDFAAWLILPRYLFRSYASVAYDPVTSAVPLWWRLILWCARQGRGVQVRYQRIGHESPLPKGVQRRTYDCQKESFFTDTPLKILASWGVPLEHVTLPSLPRRSSPEGKPYILFHFFAANYSRSIPTDHARSILLAARTQFPNHLFILTCAENERARAERMIEGVSGTRIEENLPATEVIALLSGADIVVGTSSGIIFMAVHLGVSVVAMSCLVDPCFLPTYSTTTTILAARDECWCNSDKTGGCVEETPEGEVFRCLYYIPTEAVVEAMVGFSNRLVKN